MYVDIRLWEDFYDIFFRNYFMFININSKIFLELLGKGFLFDEEIFLIFIWGRGCF